MGRASRLVKTTLWSTVAGTREMVWGDLEGSEFVRANGRMVAKVDGGWKLRNKKLGGGKAAPFALDPDLLFTVLKELPADARAVTHVEVGEVAGKKVVILSMTIENEAAGDLADSGALPGGGGPGGGMLMFGGGGGMGAPEIEHTVYVALHVDPDSGDLLRFAAKVFEKNPMMGNMQIQVQGGPGGDVEDPDEGDEKDEAPASGAPTWKKGFPVKKPAKDESVTTFRADFKKLGLAEAPALDAKTKAMLRMR